MLVISTELDVAIAVPVGFPFVPEVPVILYSFA